MAHARRMCEILTRGHLGNADAVGRDGSLGPPPTSGAAYRTRQRSPRAGSPVAGRLMGPLVRSSPRIIRGCPSRVPYQC